jgi:hypothetical protein
MSVFSELLKLWPDFQALRSSVREEKLLSVLEEQEQKHRASLQRRRRRQAKLEQKNAQVPSGECLLTTSPCTVHGVPLAASSGRSWKCSYSYIIFRRQLEADRNKTIYTSKLPWID